MKQTVFQVKDERLWALSEGDLEVSTVTQHWKDWLIAEEVVSVLEPVGVGRPKINFIETSQGAIVQLVFLSEVGEHVAPQGFDQTWDHFIDDGFLVPLRHQEVSVIFELLAAAGVRLGSPISLSQLFRLLVEFRGVGIEFDVPSSFEELTKFEPKAANLEEFTGTPYQYQKVGIDWLTDYFDSGLGALLCDEMGLGKTFQAIGLIGHALSVANSRVLVIVPATLVENWRKEFAQFLPTIEPYVHQGPIRAARLQEIEKEAVTITTYDTLLRDASLFASIPFSLIVCDEAQALKSRLSRRHEVVKSLNSTSKVLVTGTPLENKLTDLVALVDIVQPGLLGDPGTFEEMVEDTPHEAREVGKLASPLILRRRVAEVAKDLPELVTIETPMHPTAELAEIYNEVRMQSLGSERQKSFLATLTALTQVCCHPKLVVPGARDPQNSKFARLYAILSELADANQDKVIIFSTFIESIDLIAAFVRRHFGESSCLTIDGRVSPRERQSLVDAFNSSSGFKALIVNPKAGGTGLNITGANHVVHFNRQWNPAVEAQATARAYRRKQEKPVFVHKFFYIGTVEEVISERLAKKSGLADAALEDAEQAIDSETKEKLMSICPTTMETL